MLVKVKIPSLSHKTRQGWGTLILPFFIALFLDVFVGAGEACGGFL